MVLYGHQGCRGRQQGTGLRWFSPVHGHSNPKKGSGARVSEAGGGSSRKICAARAGAGGGGAGGGGASKTESGELLEGGRANAPPQANNMTLKGALAVFKRFRKKHPERRFEIRLGAGAQVVG